MHFSPSTILLPLGLALVHTSFANPAPAGMLSKRTVDNLPPSDQFIACPGYRYSREQVEKAIQQAIYNTPTTAPQPGMLIDSLWQQQEAEVLRQVQRQDAERIPPLAWR
jgi:hypothetical protein